MAILEVVRMGHPVLRQAARRLEPHEISSAEITTLINDMTDTLHDQNGIGLAAPQVNQSIQLAIIEIVDGPNRYEDIPSMPLTAYINPVITVLSADTAGYWEGCLSIPGLRGYVERPQHIKVDYASQHGDLRCIELEGFLATVFQHEFDHLHGKLYIDKLVSTNLLSFEEEFLQFGQ